MSDLALNRSDDTDEPPGDCPPVANQCMTAGYRERETDLDPARGISLGIIIGVVFWVAIITAVKMLLS